jgi:hypothetical protein
MYLPSDLNFLSRNTMILFIRRIAKLSSQMKDILVQFGVSPMQAYLLKYYSGPDT